MNIEAEARELRTEVLNLRSDRRRRYPDDLRRRILDWVERAEGSGIPRVQCVKLIGMNAVWRIGHWRREMKPATNDSGLALVQVATPTTTSSSGVALVTPSGYRVEGLELEQLTTLLRELA